MKQNVKVRAKRVISMVLVLTMLMQMVSTGVAFAANNGTRYIWEIFDVDPVSHPDAVSQGYVTDEDPDAYPNAGSLTYGGYWYVYDGSDNIDPSGLTTSKTKATPGETITLIVASGTGTRSVGVITYIFEQSTDGGNTWVTVGSTDDSTKEVTVPNNVAEVRYRVSAMDNLGFESNVWIESAAITIDLAADAFDDITNIPNAGEDEGAFYVPEKTPTVVEGGNEIMEDYIWVDDNRVYLVTYPAIRKGDTSTPDFSKLPFDIDDAQSVTYTVVEGEDLISLNSDTGEITATEYGDVVVDIVVIGPDGEEVLARGTLHIAPIPVESVSLSYSNIAVGATGMPSLTINPGNADIDSIVYSIVTGSSFVSLDPATGKISGAEDGVAVIKAIVTDVPGNTKEVSTSVIIGTLALGTRYVWDKFDYKEEGYYWETVKYPTNQHVVMDLADGTYYYLSFIPSSAAKQSSSSINLTSSVSITNSSNSSLRGKWISTQGATASVLYHVAAADDTGSVTEITAYEYASISYFSESKGTTTIGKASSDLANKYPANGRFSSYWYAYKGSDVIDPASVTISPTKSLTNSVVTATVAPSDKNVYGGTINYTYQYSTDGGSTWITAGTTTATTYDITIPAGADTLLVQVRASDTWGFTSPVWVMSNSIETYTGISGIEFSYPILVKGQSFEPILNILPADNDGYEIVSYERVSGSCVSIDPVTGKLTCSAAGTAQIKVTVKDVLGNETSKTITVTVPKMGVSSLSLSYSEMNVNETGVPTLTINPVNYDTLQKITYEITSGGTLASIDGITGAVTPTRPGSITIKATVVDALGTEHTATATVPIKAPLKGISLSDTAVAMKVGDSKTLSVIYDPDFTTDDKAVTWTTNNAAVATVNNGVITPVAPGAATITATVGYFSATCVVTIDLIEISTLPKQNQTLTYNGTIQTPVWTNLDENKLEIVGGTKSAVNAGIYSITVKPKANYKWWDGTTDEKQVEWKIEKATGVFTLSDTTVNLLPGEEITITVSREGDGEISVVNSDTSVATTTISGTTITVSALNAGETTISVQLASGTNHTEASSQKIAVIVDRLVISALPEQKGSLVYNQSAQAPVWNNYDPSQLALNVTARINAGTYSAEFVPTKNYKWSDGTYGAKQVSWSIERAAGNITVSANTFEVEEVCSTIIGIESYLGNGRISVSSSDNTIAVATLVDNEIVILGKKPGDVKITVSIAQSQNYEADSVVITGTVVEAAGPEIFAVLYSDGELVFYKNGDYGTIKANYFTSGYLYNDRSVSGVFTGFESTVYSNKGSVPWGSYSVKTVSFDSTFASVEVKSTAYWFYNKSTLTSFDSTNLNMSEAVSAEDMFLGCSSLETVDLSGINAPKLATMEAMFANCTSLTSVDFTGFTTSSELKNINSMFNGCKGIETVDFKTLNTSGVESMSLVFNSCSKLLSVNMSSFDTRNATDMSHLIWQSPLVEEITIGDHFCFTGNGTTSFVFPTPDPKEIAGTDGYWHNHETGEVFTPEELVANHSGTVTYSAISLSFAVLNEDGSFVFYKRVGAPKVGDVFQGKTVSAVYAGFETGSFSYASPPWYSQMNQIKSVSFADVIKPENTAYWFNSANQIISFDGTNLDTSNTKLMNSMFNYCKNLSSLDLGETFNTKSATNMSMMFCSCSSLKSIDLGDLFYTSSVEDMSSMFYSCTALESIDVGPNFSAEKVTTTASMFYNCYSLLSLDLGSKFTSPLNTDTSNMFYKCSSLQTLDIGAMSTRNATNMNGMFYSVDKLETVTLGADFVFNECYLPYPNRVYNGLWYDIETGIGYTPTNLSSSHNKKTTYSIYALSYAVLSTDGSLIFYKNNDFKTITTALKSGTYEYNGKEVSKTFSGFEFISPSSASSMPWYSSRSSITSISFDPSYADVKPTTLAYWFASMSDLISFDGRNLNTSEAKSMAYMFDGNWQMTGADLRSFDTGKVSTMCSMFRTCSSLVEITLGANFEFVGTDGYLPTQNTVYVERADGKWYNKETEESFTAAELAAVHGGSTVTYMSRPPKVAFAVLDSDGTLAFYKNTDYDDVYADLTENSSTTYKDRTVTAVYTGFAEEEYNTVSKVPWNGDISNIKAVVVTESFAPVSLKYWFQDAANMVSCDMSLLDASKISSLEYAFGGCSSLASLDLRNWKTSEKLISLAYAFYHCSSLKSILFDSSNWNVSKVTTMNGTFNGCSSLVSIDVNWWDVSSVTTTNGMFSGCSQLDSIDVSNWNTVNTSNMAYMFSGCSNADVINISGLKTNSLTAVGSMFYQCSDVLVLDVSQFDTSRCMYMNYTFNGCSSIKNLDLSGWSTANCSSMNYTFGGMTSLETITLGADFVWVGTKGNLPAQSFAGADGKWYNVDTNEGYTPSELASNHGGTKCTYTAIIPVVSNPPTFLPQDSWYQGSVARTTFTSIEIVNDASYTGLESWDASVEQEGGIMCYIDGTKLIISINGSKSAYSNENASYMFSDSSGSRDYFSALTSFTGIDKIDGTNTSDWSYSFMAIGGLGSSPLSIDLSGLVHEAATNLCGMFDSAMTISSIDVSGWRTANVTQMGYCFSYLQQVKVIDLSDWDVSNTSLNFNYMFQGCTSLTTVYINGSTLNTFCIHAFNGCSTSLSLHILDYTSGSNIYKSLRIVEMKNGVTIYYPDGTIWEYGVQPTAAFALLSREEVIMDSSTLMLDVVRSGSYPTLASGTSWYKGTTKKSSITEIRFVNSYSGTGMEDEAWDASVSANGSVMCYVIEGVLIIAGDGTGKIAANQNSDYAFSGTTSDSKFSSVTKITGIELLETSNALTMKGMFSGMSSLTELDLSSFSTMGVTDASDMADFASGTPALSTIDLGPDFGQYLYHIEYHGNGATSGDMTSGSHTFGSQHSLSANAFSRQNTILLNYNGSGKATEEKTITTAFKGWSNSEHSNDILYTNGALISNPTTVPGATVHLHAVWENSGIVLPTASRTGYIFLGWATSSDAETPQFLANETFVPSGTTTLYAVWLEQNYLTITSQPSSISVDYPNTALVHVTIDALDDATVTYQWQTAYKASGPWSDINGATERTYSTDAQKTAGEYYYRCVVTAAIKRQDPIAVITNTAKVTINKIPGLLTLTPGTDTLLLLGYGPIDASVATTQDGSTISKATSSDESKVSVTMNGSMVRLNPVGTTGVKGVSIQVTTSGTENYEPATKTFNAYVSDGPTVSVTYSTEQSTNQDVNVYISATNVLTGKFPTTLVSEVTVNGIVIPSTAPGNFVYVATENGTLDITATDGTGKTTTAQVVIDWIDKQPPTISSISSLSVNVGTGKLSTYFSAYDDQTPYAELEYCWNYMENSSENVWTKTSIMDLDPGTSITVAVRDKAGNITIQAHRSEWSTTNGSSNVLANVYDDITGYIFGISSYLNEKGELSAYPTGGLTFVIRIAPSTTSQYIGGVLEIGGVDLPVTWYSNPTCTAPIGTTSDDGTTNLASSIAYGKVTLNPSIFVTKTVKNTRANLILTRYSDTSMHTEVASERYGMVCSIDLAPPVISAFYDAKTNTMSLRATDTISGVLNDQIDYIIGGVSSTVSASADIRYPDSDSDGSFTVTVIASDTLGNTTSSSYTFDPTLETVADGTYQENTSVYKYQSRLFYHYMINTSNSNAKTDEIP